MILFFSFPPRAHQRDAWGKVPVALRSEALDRRKGGVLPDTRARALRRNMTDAERVLWSVLRRKQLSGFRFRRQVQIGPFIADFFCPKTRLVVEVDGAQHSQQENAWYDYLRTKWLEAHGYRVFRVWNEDVFRSPEDIADAIYRVLKAPLPSPGARLRRAGDTFPPLRGGKEKI